MDEKGLGKRLQEARQAAGLTQQQLCHQANLSFSTLAKIERGAIKSPSIFTIQAIATALGTGLDELVGQSAPGKPGRQLLKTKSGVSFVYFDVNGCLIHFYQRAFVKLSADTGVPADIVEAAYWQFNDDVCRGELSLSDFNTKLAERLGVDSVTWQDYYLSTIEPIPQMQELLVWASERYRVGLMTNIMPGLVGSMRRAGQIPDLQYDVIVDSSEVGAIKPEAKVYEIAMERAGVSADEILLIDDSRVNLMAAGKMGWHVLWFDDSRPEEMTDRVREALQPAT
ncbi:MAG TPA: HAD-IA family hydrolase [Candidatus Saccharimonadales bacterium]|jgi:putative hydrolase of the HAD superfamily|nr:HAD-IA family hydrolase [Candidatus Saccharimonadales bacterium]